MWHPASIHGILCNPTYTGVLRSGESRSPILPELQIIPTEQFERAQLIRKERSATAQSIPSIPINTRGQSLLSGNVFCGHCGARLTLTTSKRYRKLRDGSYDKTPRIRYVCYGKTRKQTECTGQTGCTLHMVITSAKYSLVFARFAFLLLSTLNNVINNLSLINA